MYVSALKRIWSYHSYAACSALAEIMKTYNLWVVVYVGLRLQMLAWHKHIKCQSVPKYTYWLMTVWYHAPDILLGFALYSIPVDVWGIGCIMASWAMQDPRCPKSSNMTNAPFTCLVECAEWLINVFSFLFFFLVKIVFYKISFVCSIKPTKSIIE